MTHIKKITLLLAASFLIAPYVYALENLTENDLAQVTGQDGITAMFILPAQGWTAQEIVLTDKTGIPNTVKPGYDFASASILAKDVGVKVCSEASINGLCTSIWQGIKLDFDVVGDVANTGAMLNIHATLLGSKLRVYIDKIALRNGAGGNESTIIDFNHPDSVNGKDYVDLLPSSSVLFNMQLGNESAGYMVSFGTTSFASIDFGEVRLTDKTDTGVGGNGRNLRFGFKLDNVDLTGTGFDISEDGVVFSAPTLMTPMDITFSNIAVGDTITGTNTATDMGTIGIKGLQVTNFSFTLAGKS